VNPQNCLPVPSFGGAECLNFEPLGPAELVGGLACSRQPGSQVLSPLEPPGLLIDIGLA
jgi:hypothetical protein